MQNLNGLRFGRLVVLEYSHIGTHRRRMWKCICDCGTQHTVAEVNLQNGNSSSCGCLKLERQKAATTKHGLSEDQNVKREYKSWVQMRHRCSCQTHHAYQHYGGRGITYCERWNDFSNFLHDMGPRPNGTSLERKEVDGPYEPSNCYWATPEQQSNNRRKTLLITVGNKSQTAARWGREYGINRKTIESRYRNGVFSPEKLFAPPKSSNKLKAL